MIDDKAEVRRQKGYLRSLAPGPSTQEPLLLLETGSAQMQTAQGLGNAEGSRARTGQLKERLERWAVFALFAPALPLCVPPSPREAANQPDSGVHRAPAPPTLLRKYVYCLHVYSPGGFPSRVTVDKREDHLEVKHPGSGPNSVTAMLCGFRQVPYPL